MKTRDKDGYVTVSGLVLGFATVVSLGTLVAPVLYLVNGGDAAAVFDRIDGLSFLGKFLVAGIVTGLFALWGRTVLMFLDIENEPGGFAGWMKRTTGCDCKCRILRRGCAPKPA